MMEDLGTRFGSVDYLIQKEALAMSGNFGRGGLGLPGVKESLLQFLDSHDNNEGSADVAATIQAIPEEQIFERSIVGRNPLTTWLSISGRVALVDDAAHGMHPNIGQDANSAFVSAAAVVQAMEKQHQQQRDVTTAPGWTAALAEYEAFRKPQADLVQQFANAMGILQSTGKQYVSQKTMFETIDWIAHNETVSTCPEETVEFLKRFDPLQKPGISLLS